MAFHSEEGVRVARRRFGRPGRGIARRSTDWQFATGVPSGLISVASGAQAVLGSVAIGEGAGLPGTLVRIRGNVHIEIAAETAAQTMQLFGVGVGLFDDRALAVSPAAAVGLPRPVSDTDSEKWMWIDFGFLGTYDLGFALPNEGDGTGRRLSIDIPVDSKAKRKWDENLTLVWLCENLAIDGAATELDVAVMGRMLIMPP